MSESTPPLRLLMLCYYFPPEISGGARRPALWCRNLPDAGIDCAVVTPAEPGPAEAGLNVIHVPRPWPMKPVRPAAVDATGSPGAARALLRPLKTLIRRHLLLPDVFVPWSRRAVRRLLVNRQLSPPDWILSTSPPESTHLAAAALKRAWGCRWAADLRDSWITHGLKPELDSPWRRRRERRMARRILSAADVVTVTSMGIREEVQGLLDPGGPEVHLLPNFYDPAAVADPIELDKSFFHLVHTGSFLAGDAGRSPAALLAALGDLARGEPGFAETFRLHLVGPLVAGERRMIAESGAGGLVDCPGPVSAAAALGWQRAADALLLLTAPGTVHVPGKLYEYLATARPLALITDAPEVLRQAPRGCGEIAPPSDRAAIATALGKMWRAWRFTSDWRDAYAYATPEEFGAPAAARRLAELLRR